MYTEKEMNYYVEICIIITIMCTCMSVCARVRVWVCVFVYINIMLFNDLFKLFRIVFIVNTQIYYRRELNINV